MASISYEDSGVSISEQDEFVARIQKINPNIGGFGGVFPLPIEGYKNPCLVAGTDGVGTKLLVSEMVDRYDTVGIDLVAMVVNDIICCGAKPLFFLDYYATGKLDANRAEDVLKGILEGCSQSDCKLIGGETAELPGLYSGKHFDLAGFAVGVVDADKVIDGSKVEAGDIMIGLGSSGIHSNGVSLARKALFDSLKLSPTDTYEGLSGSVADYLLTPTHIYVKPVLELIQRFNVKAIAHITGGGLTDNVPRVLPKGLQAEFQYNSWRKPEIFDVIEKGGPVERSEMLHTFNMGLGMVLVLPASQKAEALALCEELKVEAFAVGEISTGDQGTVIHD